MVATIGVWWLNRPDEREASAREISAALAASLTQGALPAGLRVDPRVDLEPVVAGMDDAVHRVTAGTVEVNDHRDAATVALRHEWTVQPGQQPWTYDTTAQLEWRADHWQVRWSPQILAPGLHTGERMTAYRLSAVRGEVVGGDGTPLVTERAVFRIGVDRARTDPATALASARDLGKALEIDVDRYVARVEGAGPKAFVEALVVREGDPRVRDLPALALSGVVALSDELPLAPTAGFARPLLGTVSEATAEDITASRGRLRVGDLVGMSGLQKAHETRLAGTTGYVVRASIPGDRARDLHRVPPVDGLPVHVTLDEKHQLAAEHILEQVGPASAVVMVRPSDGHVLAAASGPGSKGYSTATLGQYAPGSTFKTVTLLSLLRTGLTSATTSDCSPTLTVDGARIKNYSDYPSDGTGPITLRSAYANSCNTALIRLRDRVRGEALPQAAADVGLTATPSLGVPAFLGAVPVPTTEVDLSMSMIGQGRVLSSPLGMATVAASVVAGRPVQPVLVTTPPTTRSPSAANPSTATTTPAQPGPPAAPTRPGGRLLPYEGSTLRDLMRATATEGSAAVLGSLPGDPVLAKTGTAEYGTERPPRTHSWMIASRGDLALCVFVEDRTGKSSTALPILTRLLEDLNR